MAHPQYPHLFSPIEIRGKKLRNRIVQSAHDAPHAMVAGECGYSNLSDHQAHYLALIARGGAAVVNTGHIGVDPRFRLGSNGFLINLFSGRTSMTHHQLPAFQLITDLAHSFGALASIEFNHGGHYCTPVEGNQVLGPMSMTMDNGLEVVGMDRAEMERVAEYYAEAAYMGKKGGFDMINVHAAHNWLLGEFFSPVANRREDEYGGSVENRARFPLMVLRYIRERVGGDMLISVRFSAAELVEGGITMDETIQSVNLISQYADIVHCSAGKIHNELTSSYVFPTQYTEHGVNTYLAGAVKKGVNIPVETVGGINDPAMAEQLLADGVCDLVSMARTFIADPEWGLKAKTGRSGDIRPCIRCLRCLNTSDAKTGKFECTVNPARMLFHTLTPPTVEKAKKQVAVVGGGPAGLLAASELADRGHKVILLEKSDTLGGRLSFADHVVFKEDIRRYREYLIRQVEGRDIDIRLGTEATPEAVAALKPDAVIVAIGAKPNIPPIPGADLPHVLHAADLFGSEAAVGGKVVIVGGGMVGCEAAIHLHSMGKAVDIVEMADELMAGEKQTLPTEREATLFYVDHAFDIKNKSFVSAPKLDTVNIYTGARCVEIREGCVVIEQAGKRCELAADTVILATGFVVDKAQRDAYGGIAMDVIDIGDCKQVGSIHTTSTTAYYAARELSE